MRAVLTEEVANRIYDILVEDCGAQDSMRRHWLYHQTNPDEHTTEWRFSGYLGFGGKFWRNMGKWYVNAYPEDSTPRRDKMISVANEKLEALREEFKFVRGVD